MKKLIYLLNLFAVIVIASCTADDDTLPAPATNLPIVITSAPVKVNDTTYTCGGNVTAEGASSVAERGVVVSLDANPTINDANDVVVPNGAGTGAFAMDLSPFYVGYTYHIRAYAKNANDVAYGADVTVTPGSGPNPTGCNVVTVNSNITTPTTWTAGNVYVVESWIDIDAPLTIQPGVVVKFATGAGMEVYAKITAGATAANPIIFTSYKDDSYCGDNNGDGAASSPAKGDWGRLTMRGDQHGSLFKYCKFLWGGADNSGVILTSSGTGNIHDFTFDYCTFAHTHGTNSYLTAAFNGGEMYDETISVVTNNIFYDNAIPIRIKAKYALSSSNVYHNPGNPGEINKYNGIFVYGGNMGGRSVVYGETEVPYVFNVGGNATLSVGSSDFLKIEPNVILKFGQSYAGLDLGDYQNNANIAASAIFTSYRDDARGGDTNGDGSTSSPATGDWDGYGYWTTGHGSYIWVQTNVFYDAH